MNNLFGAAWVGRASLSLHQCRFRKPSWTLFLSTSYHVNWWTLTHLLAPCLVENSGQGQMCPPSGEKHRPSGCHHHNRGKKKCSCFHWLSFSRSCPGKATKLSKWGSSRLCWKMQTPKSSITPGFHHPRFPSSSFWILVSSMLCWDIIYNEWLSGVQGRAFNDLCIIHLTTVLCLTPYSWADCNTYRYIQAAVKHNTQL